jgi:hypothetical protein
MRQTLMALTLSSAARRRRPGGDTVYSGPGSAPWPPGQWRSR